MLYSIHKAVYCVYNVYSVGKYMELNARMCYEMQCMKDMVDGNKHACYSFNISTAKHTVASYIFSGEC